MIAICQFCGASKASPFLECLHCQRRPYTDEQHGEALLFSSACMSPEDLKTCGALLTIGTTPNLPQAAKDAATAAYRKLRLEEADRAAKTAATKRRRLLAFLGLALPCFLVWLLAQSPDFRLWFAEQRDIPEAYLSVMKRFPNTPQGDAANKRYRELTDDAAWAGVVSAPTFDSLRKYKTDYPHGKHHHAADDAIFALVQPQWEHYKTSGTLTAIEQYPDRFPEVSARFPVQEALEARWRQGLANQSLDEIAQFLTLSPAWKAKWPVIETMVRLAEPRWAVIKQARSVDEILHFQKTYPEIHARFNTEEAIEALYNDPAWVKAQDKLVHYQRFVQRHPRHAATPAMEKRIIDLEVADIARGEHGELPQPQPVGSSYGTITSLQIKNDTEYELTVRYSGPDSKKVVIPSAKTQSLTLPNGSYKVAASVNARHVTNYYGTNDLQGGRYDTVYYISTGAYGLPGIGLPGRGSRARR